MTSHSEQQILDGWNQLGVLRKAPLYPLEATELPVRSLVDSQLSGVLLSKTVRPSRARVSRARGNAVRRLV